MNRELANYLKSKIGLNRMFIELKKKYISLGRYSGTIKLTNITKEESIDLGNLLGKKVEEHSTLSTSFREITKKIEEGKYRGFDWQAVFENYFKEKIVCKQERIEQEAQEEVRFFESVIEEYQHSRFVSRLEKEIREQGEVYRIMHQKYRKSRERLKSEIDNVMFLLSQIPKEPTSLPVYASLTGNPHYLDFNRSTSNFFFKVLSMMKEEDFPSKLQDKVSLLSEINVYTDFISNFVIVYQIVGSPLLEELAEKKQVLNLNLLNIHSIESLDTKNKKVFIFENPSILNTMISLDIPIIITSGNPNLALYRVLEKLDNNHNTLYYNGDFDPEGLLIAEKLKRRFPNLRLFCYEQTDYEKCKSQEKIIPSRLKKLQYVVSPELEEIKKILLKTSLAAYQESNLDRILNYVTEEYRF